MEQGEAGGTRGGGWDKGRQVGDPKVANSMCHRKALEGTGRAIYALFGINGDKLSQLVGPPFPAFKASFSALLSWHLHVYDG